MCLRLRPRSPRPPSWLNTGSLLLRDGEGKGGGEKRREGNWKGREAWGERGEKGGWDRVRERSGTGREGRLFENVARGGGLHPKCGPGPPATLRRHWLHIERTAAQGRDLNLILCCVYCVVVLLQ